MELSLQSLELKKKSPAFVVGVAFALMRLLWLITDRAQQIQSWDMNRYLEKFEYRSWALEKLSLVALILAR